MRPGTDAAGLRGSVRRSVPDRVRVPALVRALAMVLALLTDVGRPGPAGAQTPPGGWTVDATGAMVPARRTEGSGQAPSGPVNGTVSVAAPAAAPAGLDYAMWERMAGRAEAAIEDSASTDVSLELMRAQLVDWREAMLGAQNANSARIATLRTQIAALGPAPAEGETEAEEIAKRRGELTEQLVRLQAPGIAAEEAYRRADGLIREIDRVLRERQADELLRLLPAPINPTHWPEGLATVSDLVVTLWDERAAQRANPDARAAFRANLPRIVLAVGFAFAVLWRGRRWIDRQVGRLMLHATVRGARIWGFLASLGLIVVPTMGMVALSYAFSLSNMMGPVGLVIAGALPGVTFPLFAAMWLGGRLFPADPTADQGALPGATWRGGGRILISTFGALISLDALRRVAFQPLMISDAALAVLSFPFLLAAGLLLFRIGQLLMRRVEDAVDDERRSFQNRTIGLLARTAMGIGITGPLLAAVGYVPAAEAIVYPAAISLWLMGLLNVLQRLIGDIYVLVMRQPEADHEGLVPVLAGFAMTLATLPLFALVWGARLADITELWTRFREGFTLGDTRVSPTDFLFFAVIFGIGFGLTRMLQGALKATILPRTSLDQGGQNAIVSVLGYVGIFLAGLIAINSTGIDLSGLAIVAGALSVGIGFGLQTIVGNFVSGIILLIERPVSEGDWIEVGGVQGIVKSISVRSTRIQTFDRSDVIVPNQDLISGQVTNWTRYNLTGRLIVPVGVAFGSDTRKVERVLREIAEAQPMAVLNPPPLILLMGFGADAMNFEIRVILRDVNFSLAVRTEINHQIVERFAKEGIEIPFSQTEVYLRNPDDLGRALAELRGPVGRRSPDPRPEAAARPAKEVR